MYCHVLLINKYTTFRLGVGVEGEDLGSRRESAEEGQ